MILPNKLIPFKVSVISKLVYILDILSVTDDSVESLFEKTSHNFEDVNQFIVALDVLFALEKIEIDEELKVIRYVKANYL
ncbi:ABC-three component system middle component 7 [Paenibacillus sp. PSB04]|uniref:ABC-three component system middle component 7 n=1 Tax=Paenibacillus sp. PSB04 TaxID=2866810 RepID=UPI00298E0DC4|nr:ABC-three component system middle component 7 [Paenibacillus sp. PSB04]